MAQVLASRNPHYTVSADGIALFDPKLNEAAANFEKLTAFVKKIRFRFPQLKFLVHFYQKDFDEITNITVDRPGRLRVRRRGRRHAQGHHQDPGHHARQAHARERGQALPQRQGPPLVVDENA